MPRLVAQMGDAVRTGQPIEIEALATAKGGKPHWMEISTTAILAADGQPTHFIRMGRDITARKTGRGRA